MTVSRVGTFCVVLLVAVVGAARAESIDSRVIQIKLPAEDVTLYYMEQAPSFTVKMKTESSSVEGPKLWIGDGEIAIDLVAHSFKGIFLQGQDMDQGDQFKDGATIKVRPGWKRATELKPGDVYVILPGVFFDLRDVK